MDIVKSILNALVLMSLFSRDKNLNSHFLAEVICVIKEKMIRLLGCRVCVTKQRKKGSSFRS